MERINPHFLSISSSARFLRSWNRQARSFLSSQKARRCFSSPSTKLSKDLFRQRTREQQRKPLCHFFSLQQVHFSLAAAHKAPCLLSPELLFAFFHKTLYAGQVPMTRCPPTFYQTCGDR